MHHDRFVGRMIEQTTHHLLSLQFIRIFATVRKVLADFANFRRVQVGFSNDFRRVSFFLCERIHPLSLFSQVKSISLKTKNGASK